MRVTLITAICLSATACREASRQTVEPAPSAAQAPTGAISAPPSSEASADRVSEPPFVGTAGVVDKPAPTGVVLLKDVRTGQHPGYDRVVFEFAGDVLPGYHLEYIDTPVRKCGSGHTTAIAGDGWLEVRFAPAAAHDDHGRATIAERERQLKHGVLRELELTCDFEAVVSWVLGVASPNRFRVLELREPTRLAVDIRHGR